ncbi:RNA polymerase sigma factor [Haloechinothrix aidingensis]|nr:sigma-70 family RNA polymerase sigma factor [Haloechinothrix aidingensis]
MTGAVVDAPDSSVVWEQVEAVQEGDTAAFAEIYRRYASVVWAYVYHRTGDVEVTKDVTSETFLRALRRIELVTDIGKDLRAWLCTIARNIVIDLAKSWWGTSVVTTADVDPYAGASRGPEADVIERCTAAEIDGYLQRLSRPQRRCVRLRFFQGLSVRETAEIMQRDERAVRALQHRAIRRLSEVVLNDERVTRPAAVRDEWNTMSDRRARVAERPEESRRRSCLGMPGQAGNIARRDRHYNQ